MITLREECPLGLRFDLTWYHFICVFCVLSVLLLCESVLALACVCVLISVERFALIRINMVVIIIIIIEM